MQCTTYNSSPQGKLCHNLMDYIFLLYILLWLKKSCKKQFPAMWMGLWCNDYMSFINHKHVITYSVLISYCFALHLSPEFFANSRLYWWDGNVQILQHSRLYCFKDPNKLDGGLQSYYQYTKLLYILTLPSHQNNLELCKNFWTKHELMRNMN